MKLIKRSRQTNKVSKKKKLPRWARRTLIALAAFFVLLFGGLMTFFHTDVFAKERDAWVQTAMATSNHKWLATAFLSQSEIDKILAKYEVKNTTNSDSNTVTLSSKASNTTTIKNISGSTYKGYVVSVSDPSKVKLVNTLTSSGSGTNLSETVSSGNYSIAMNAAGFNFSPQSNSSSSSALDSLTIMDGKLLYGDTTSTYQMIGMSSEGKLILGNYTYDQAIKAGIEDAISFGPYLIVNGESQVTEESTGGYQPRSAIGQAADGTIYMVVIEGRTTSSTGATLYQLQEVMKSLGCVNAVNLDGGGSSELYYNSSLVNTLSNGSERALPNAFVVTK